MDDRRNDWRSGVDGNLASLNAGQRVWERDLLQIRKLLDEIDKSLRGDSEKDTDGLIARIHDLETQIAKLDAVIFMDPTGKRGLLHEVEVLSTGERMTEYHWKFATAIAVAILSLVGLLITNWDRIQAYIARDKPDKLEQMIDHAKHPPAVHRHYTVIIKNPEGEDQP